MILQWLEFLTQFWLRIYISEIQILNPKNQFLDFCIIENFVSFENLKCSIFVPSLTSKLILNKLYLYTFRWRVIMSLISLVHYLLNLLFTVLSLFLLLFVCRCVVALDGSFNKHGYNIIQTWRTSKLTKTNIFLTRP